jgi:hypothetical protein
MKKWANQLTDNQIVYENLDRIVAQNNKTNKKK